MSLWKHLKHDYEWIKSEYWISLILIFLGKFWIQYSPIQIDWINLGLLATVTLSSFMFIDRDFFSWKYLQSIPLEKNALLKFHILKSLLRSIPFVICYILFHREYFEIILEKKNVEFVPFLFSVGYLICGVVFLSICHFGRYFALIRAPYSNKKTREAQLQNLRNILFVAFVVLYLFFGVMFIESAFPFLEELAKFISALGNKYSFFAAAIAFLFWNYKRTLKYWMNEQFSYTKINWKPRRDIPLMLLAVFLIRLPILKGMETPPDIYGNSPYIDAIHNKEDETIDTLISKGVNINTPSTTGFTPLMMAAHQGRTNLYFYLKSNGATIEGKYFPRIPRYKKNEIVSAGIHRLSLFGNSEEIVKDLFDETNVNMKLQDNNPIHIAAMHCSDKILDYLILKGADINAVDSNGKTALHLTSEMSCLKGSIALIEAGADLLLKDKKNKLAFDYLKDKKSDMAFYFDRKLRQPASKK